MLEDFEKHMKFIGYNNQAMLRQFIEHKKAMRNSYGEHVPFAGIKRKVAENKKSSASQPKQKKKRSTKPKKTAGGDVGIKNNDGKEAAGESDSASG